MLGVGNGDGMNEQDRWVGRTLLERGLVTPDALQRCAAVVTQRRGQGQSAEVLPVLVELGVLARDVAAALWRELHAPLPVAQPVSPAAPPSPGHGGAPASGPYGRPPPAASPPPAAPPPAAPPPVAGPALAPPGWSGAPVAGHAPPAQRFDPTGDLGGVRAPAPADVLGFGPPAGGGWGPQPALQDAPTFVGDGAPVGWQPPGAGVPAGAGLALPMGPAAGLPLAGAAPPGAQSLVPAFGESAEWAKGAFQAPSNDGEAARPIRLGGPHSGPPAGPFAAAPAPVSPAGVLPGVQVGPGPAASGPAPDGSAAQTTAKSGARSPSGRALKRRPGRARAQPSRVARSSTALVAAGAGALVLVVAAAVAALSLGSGPPAKGEGAAASGAGEAAAAASAEPTGSQEPAGPGDAAPAEGPPPPAAVAPPDEVDLEPEEALAQLIDRADRLAERDEQYAEAVALLEGCPADLSGLPGQAKLSERVEQYRRWLRFAQQLEDALRAGADSPQLRRWIQDVARGRLEPDLAELPCVERFRRQAEQLLGEEEYDRLTIDWADLEDTAAPSEELED